MTTEQSYEKIKQTYNSEKGKNFILHLIRSFLPANKSSYLWDSKPGSKCSITGQLLIGKVQAISVMTENADAQFKHNNAKMLASLEDKEEKIEEKNQEESPIRKALGKKVLGVTCTKSDKLLCVASLQALQKFAIDQMLAGDKTIQYSVNKQRREEVPQQQKEQQKTFKKVEQSKPEVKRATSKLGDISSLQALKDKMEQAERNS